MNNPQLQNARCGKRLHHTCEYIIFELHHSIPVLHKSRQLNGTPFVCSVSGRNKVRNKFSPFHRGISPFDVEPKGFKFMHCQLLIHSNCCTKCFSNVASIFLTCNAILHLVRLKPSKIRPSFGTTNLQTSVSGISANYFLRRIIQSRSCHKVTINAVKSHHSFKRLAAKSLLAAHFQSLQIG